jgi:hypothetical protein
VGRQRRAIEMALQTPLSAEDEAVLADFRRRERARDEATAPPSNQSISSKDEGE